MCVCVRECVCACGVIHPFWWRLTLACPATRDGVTPRRHSVVLYVEVCVCVCVCVCLLGCMGACTSSGRVRVCVCWCICMQEKETKKKKKKEKEQRGCLVSLNDLAPGRKGRRKNEKCVCVCVCVCAIVPLSNTAMSVHTHTHTHTKPCGDSIFMPACGKDNCCNTHTHTLTDHRQLFTCHCQGLSVSWLVCVCVCVRVCACVCVRI